MILLILATLSTAPAFASTVLYTNGSMALSSAFYLDFGYVVSDSFTVAQSTVTGFDAGIWVPAGDSPASVNWAIGGSAMSGNIASGTATLSNSYVGSNYYDFYTSTASGLNVSLGAGTYWLTLSAGASTNGNWLAWDVNSGPSQAVHNVNGNVRSEAFTIYGTSGTSTPEPGTLIMFGSGIIGLAGVLRRKINL